MKKIILPILATVVSFFILLTIFVKDLIPASIFKTFTGENTRLILNGNTGGIYIYGIFIISILIGLKVLEKIINKKIIIKGTLWTVIAIIAILVSFNQLYFFTDNMVYKFNVIPKPSLVKIKYSEVESVSIIASFHMSGGAKGADICSLNTRMYFLSKYLTIENMSLTNENIYDLGSILREKKIVPNVTYTNNCPVDTENIPSYLKSVIENSFDVKL